MKNRQRLDGDHRRTARQGGRRTQGVALVAAVAALSLAGCTSGPGSQAEFVDVLTRDDAFTQPQAECLADAVFDEYGNDDDALGKISGATSYEFLTGEDGVDGFDEFLSAQVAECTTFDLQPAGDS